MKILYVSFYYKKKKLKNTGKYFETNKERG